MLRRILSPLVVVLFLAAVALACAPQPSSPTPTPTAAPTATATLAAPTAAPASPTASAPAGTPLTPATAADPTPPSADPTPASVAPVGGPLPKLAASLSVGNPWGNAYSPYLLAWDVTDGAVYLAGERCDGGAGDCLMAVRPQEDAARRVTALPGRLSSLAAARGQVFVVHSDPSLAHHLATLAGDSGETLATVEFRQQMPEILAVDASAGTLYVRLGRQVQARSVADLQVQMALDVPDDGWWLSLLLDAQGGR
ncbi:MAG: hypothetical protein GX605_07730, partial [Chloroflexi bacterium]|nr:hypothetical protein [Chloroflexota bacterium]